MIFKCKNCDGNTVYSPEHLKMYCPYCGSLESDEKKTTGESLTTCINCGGEISVQEFMAASQCPYCDSYIIFDERVSGEYTPHLIMPFKIGKEATKKLMRDKFKSCVFAPDDFLSEVKLDSIQGMYVPFWMYDYHANCHFDGEGTKVRKWRSGDREYTETSVYHIVRDMETDFEKLPVDASDVMEDSVMDLMEPYNYAALEAFKEEYMSGFFAERYNKVSELLEPRAKSKARNDAVSMLRQSISGYNLGVSLERDSTVTLNNTQTNYALLPVWVYNYKYKGEEYRFHINGQTGKIIGKVPLSKKKVWGYGATVFSSVGLIFFLLNLILVAL